MDFNDTPEEAKFRSEVRAWLEANAKPKDPSKARAGRSTKSEQERLERAREWQAKKAEAGYAAITWPKEYGGLGGSSIHSVIYSQEESHFDVPGGFYEIGLGMCIPTMLAWATEEQKQRYVKPALYGEEIWCQLFSEPAAGSDVAGLRTKCERDGDDWIINGRKIWITRAAEADFTILMAITDPQKGAKGGMSAFLVDHDTPGFKPVRAIPMLGGEVTYEVELVDCRVPGWKLLGKEGDGFGPMQVRLGTRRMEMGAWCIGAAQRALNMMIEHAEQRSTFGQKLSERQSIQWWVADGAAKIHAARLMAYDCAWKLDQGKDVRTEISMLKVYATEMAQEIIDHAMQSFGAMGMTLEMPLQMLAGRVRNMRIYDGPSEVHRMVVARNLMNTRPA